MKSTGVSNDVTMIDFHLAAPIQGFDGFSWWGSLCMFWRRIGLTLTFIKCNFKNIFNFLRWVFKILSFKIVTIAAQCTTKSMLFLCTERSLFSMCSTDSRVHSSICIGFCITKCSSLVPHGDQQCSTLMHVHMRWELSSTAWLVEKQPHTHIVPQVMIPDRAESHAPRLPGESAVLHQINLPPF